MASFKIHHGYWFYVGTAIFLTIGNEIISFDARSGELIRTGMISMGTALLYAFTFTLASKHLYHYCPQPQPAHSVADTGGHETVASRGNWFSRTWNKLLTKVATPFAETLGASHETPRKAYYTYRFWGIFALEGIVLALALVIFGATSTKRVGKEVSMIAGGFFSYLLLFYFPRRILHATKSLKTSGILQALYLRNTTPPLAMKEDHDKAVFFLEAAGSTLRYSAYATMITLILSMIAIINVWPRNKILSHVIFVANLVTSVVGILWPAVVASIYAKKCKEHSSAGFVDVLGSPLPHRPGPTG